jgi:nucleotide-binding universal stress UspA family protein
MIEIRRILCPVDLSEHSRHALDHAVAVARWYGSSVTALHVFATVPVAAYAPGSGGPGVVMTAPEREQVLAALKDFVAPAGQHDVPFDVLTRDGDPVREILAQSTDMAADLIVIGTHGRSGFERLVLGSVTEKVLRRAACPVLSVPPRAPDVSPAAGIKYARILCAVDFSDSSMEALQYATSIAQEADARLTVLHVMEYGLHEWPELYETFMSNAHLNVAEYRQRCQASSRERLGLAVPDAVRTYCTVDTILGEGKPYREIVQVAAERRSDLIVMGVRGRSSAVLAVFGSTTQQVVRLATCPVLTIGPGEPPRAQSVG